VPIARKKKKTGTSATLFVSAKKSPAVSIMRMETLRLFKLQARQRQYSAEIDQNTIDPQKSQVVADSLGFAD